MKVRAQLNSLSEAVSLAAEQWAGDEKIVLAEMPLTIQELGRLIEKMTGECAQTEKSLRGRIESVEKVSASLQKLAEKAARQNHWFIRFLGKFGFCPNSHEKQLWPVLKQLGVFLKQWRQEEKLIKRGTTRTLKILSAVGYTPERIVRSAFNAIRKDLSIKVKECAFWTLRNLKSKDLEALDTRIQGSDPSIAHSAVIAELRAFLEAEGERMTERQKEQLRQAMAQLNRSLQFCEAETAIQFLERMEKVGLFSSRPFTLSAQSEIRQQRINEVVYEMEKAIDALPIGEALLIPGGYTRSDRTGHGVLYEIKRTSADRYQFAILNTGEGSGYGEDYLTKTFKRYWSNQAGMPLIKELSKEAVSDPKFLGDLFGYNALRSNRFAMDEVFQSIKEHLIDRNDGKLEIGPDHFLQTWGTCVFDCVMHYLEYKLPASLFHPFRHFAMNRAIERLVLLLPEAAKNNTYDLNTLVLLSRRPLDTFANSKKEYAAFYNSDPEIELARRVFAKEHIKAFEDFKLFIEKKVQRKEELERILAEAGFFSNTFGPTSGLAEEKRELVQELAGFESILAKVEFPEKKRSLKNTEHLAALYSYLHEKMGAAALFCSVASFPAAV